MRSTAGCDRGSGYCQRVSDSRSRDGTNLDGERVRRRNATILGLDFVGLVFALFFFAWSLSPSLIPRDWIYQGLVSGITSITGYGVGVLLAYPARRWIAPRFAWWPQRTTARLIAESVVATLAAATVIGTLLVAANWQRDIAELMGISATTQLAYLRTGLVGIAIFTVVLLIGRGLRRVARALARLLSTRLHIPVPAAHVVAPVLLTVAVVVFVDQVLLTGSSGAARLVFSGDNNSTEPGVAQPAEAERSGSHTSAAAWDQLGMRGRSFVDGGPRAAELTEISGTPAREPIRVYAGLQSAPDTAAQVQLILDELDRTGAWDRRILVVSATTGTGWVNPVAADSLEMMYNGDSAIAAIQYSFLPSWISFLVDGSAAAAAGEALIDGVQQRWAQLPEERRPRLVVYGESLGSQSAEAAFNDLDDLRRSVDGALFVGPPNSNALWRDLVKHRDPGTPEVRPTYDGGREVRFAADAQDLQPTAQPWLEPRVLYLQHASDPVVWWGPSLLFTRPDWLSEPPGADRVPSMRWYPIVTFWQVAADVMRGTSPPVGHGHNYEDLIPYGWAAVAPPGGWTEADTKRVAQAVAAMLPDP